MFAFSRPPALARGRAAPECIEWVTASKQRAKDCTRHVPAEARERRSAGVVRVMALCECLHVHVRILPLFARACLFVQCLVQMIGLAATVETTTRDSNNIKNMPAAMP